MGILRLHSRPWRVSERRRGEHMTNRARAEIEAQHRALAAKLGIDEATTQGIMKQVCDHLEYYSQLCQAMGVIREFSPRGMDAVASLGERMALPLLCGALEQAGVPTDAVDASQVIVTDANFQVCRVLVVWC